MTRPLHLVNNLLAFCALLGGALTATDEVHYHRDDCEEDKQVDEKAGHMQTYK
jgi:hypothetical protein